MKKITVLFTLAIISLVFGCTTSTADRSYEMGEAGQFETTLAYLAPKAELERTAINVLTASKYTVKRENGGVRAVLTSGGIHCNLFFTFEDDAININAKGSHVDGRPLMPLRRIDTINKRIQKSLGSRVPVK